MYYKILRDAKESLSSNNDGVWFSQKQIYKNNNSSDIIIPNFLANKITKEQKKVDEMTNKYYDALVNLKNRNMDDYKSNNSIIDNMYAISKMPRPFIDACIDNMRSLEPKKPKKEPGIRALTFLDQTTKYHTEITHEVIISGKGSFIVLLALPLDRSGNSTEYVVFTESESSELDAKYYAISYRKEAIEFLKAIDRYVQNNNTKLIQYKTQHEVTMLLESKFK